MARSKKRLAKTSTDPGPRTKRELFQALAAEWVACQEILSPERRAAARVRIARLMLRVLAEEERHVGLEPVTERAEKELLKSKRAQDAIDREYGVK